MKNMDREKNAHRSHPRLSITGKVFFILLILLLVPTFPLWGQSEQIECPPQPDDDALLSIVALYRQDVEEPYLQGLCRALQKHALGKKVQVEQRAYGDDEAAFDHLKTILEEEQFNIVLGPTDSGVFLRAFKELKDHPHIPVVSPLVTAEYDFDPDRAFFTTNVSLTRRSKQLAHTLSKFGLRSIMVLHSNSLFGQQTEAAFREEYLGLAPDTNYRPLQYETRGFGEKGPYRQIHQVLNDRPEGLGIFGGREEISKISKLLSEMNSTLIPYHPILFTPIDFRKQDIGDNNIFLASLSPSKDSDDVEILTYNTVLVLLDQLDPSRSFLSQRPAFLKQLANRFNGGSKSTGDTDTNMKFREGRNISDIYVLQRSPTIELSKVEAPGILEFFLLKFTLLFNTRGWWVVASLGVIVLIPILLSILDLKGWYRGNIRELLLNKFTFLFIAFNWGIVLALYLYLAETGRVPYDSPLTALIVAIGPMTFLKSTIFNTATGKAIGLSSLYDNSLKWLNGKLRNKKSELKQKFINILAYYNSLDSMEYELKKIYSHARTGKEKEKLIGEFKEELDAVESHLGKRLECAKRLFEEFTWQALIDKEYILPGFRVKDPVDPDEMIKASARFIKEQQNHGSSIMETIKKKVDAITKKFEKENLGINEEKRERPYQAISLLVQYGDYGMQGLKKDGFLQEDWGDEATELHKSNG